MQLDELGDQLPGQHGGHQVILGMHQDQRDRDLALPFIRLDQPGLHPVGRIGCLGSLAQQVISQRLDALGAAARSLSIREEEIGDGVDRLSEEIRQLKEKLHERNQQLFAGMVRNLVAAASPDADGRIRLTVLSDDLEAEEAKELARRLAEVQKARAVVAYESKGRVNYLVALGEGNAENGRDLLQQINTLLGGRGGGRPDFGQGSAPAQPGWQDQLRRLLD